MASYNDIGTVPFWKGLEDGKPYEGYAPSCGPDSGSLQLGDLTTSYTNAGAPDCYNAATTHASRICAGPTWA